MKAYVKFVFGLTALVAVACSAPSAQNSTGGKQPVDLVNPYMGNISHLLVPTFPTVHLPNSMMRMVPNRGDYTQVSLEGLPLILTGHGIFDVLAKTLNTRNENKKKNNELQLNQLMNLPDV